MKDKIASLEADLKGKDDVIQEKDKQMISKDEEIVSKDKELAESKDYNWMKKAIASKNEMVALREDEIVQLRADMQGLNEAMRAKDKVIASLKNDYETASLKNELFSKEIVSLAASKPPAQKRPRTDQDQSQPKVMSVQLEYEHTNCSSCYEKFSCDMNNKDDRIRMFLPVLSS